MKRSPINETAMRERMREPAIPGSLKMNRDDWEVVIAEIIGVFAFIAWARFFIEIFTGAT